MILIEGIVYTYYENALKGLMFYTPILIFFKRLQEKKRVVEEKKRKIKSKQSSKGQEAKCGSRRLRGGRDAER